jgi:hypothetical protein
MNQETVEKWKLNSKLNIKTTNNALLNHTLLSPDIISIIVKYSNCSLYDILYLIDKMEKLGINVNWYLNCVYDLEYTFTWLNFYYKGIK